MKVLHIIPTLRRGGAERLVIDIVRALAKQKDYDVRLLIFRNEIEYSIDDIKHLIVTIPASVSLSVLKNNTYNIQDLQVFLEQFKPDVIHSHLFEAEIVSRSCDYPNAKWFSHCHDNMVQFKSFDLKTLMYKTSLTNFYEKTYLLNRYHKNSGTTFLAISKNTLHYFSKNAKGFNAVYLPNAIQYDRFKNKTQKSISPSHKLRLINTGTFDDNKNQRFLIDVAEVLNKNCVHFEMHFLGDGKNKRSVQSYCESLALADKMHFHGSVENVESYLWEADIYVHSAKSEALGLTLIEAMAAGLPVVTLDGKGNRDLIEASKNGFMIYHQDANEFAAKIMKIWNNKKLLESMSIYANQFAQKFNIDDYIKKLDAIYRTNN
ncbi:MAG: glycosyltransferase [Bacteroidetes bacterium]|nr:glycosyltransferase [Bacteroidota bacterium]